MRKLYLMALAALPFAVAAAPTVDWTSRVAATSAGAYVMGNPAAKVKLVEYISYTCNHCAHFTGEAAKPLKAQFVAKGTTSVEFRHAVRDRLDFTASLLARCGGAKTFFRNSEAIMAAQPQWMAAGEAFEVAQAGKPAGSVNDGVKAVAAGSGLDAVMKGLGYTGAQLAACLIDESAQKVVAEMTRQSWEADGIPGTPSFTINGRRAENVASWAALEPKLRAALN